MHAPLHPLLYAPDCEMLEPDEAETAAAIVETLRSIMETTSADYGHAVRSVHAKSHGILRGELRISDILPPELAEGLFAHAATYPVVLRFSTNPGDILDDSISVPRGLAIKVVGVEGERLEGSDGSVQDFVMVNGPAFLSPDAKGFLRSLKLLAGTTDAPQVLKKVVSAALRGAESLVEAVGGQSGTLKALGGHPNTHILGETFYTQAPIRYGRYVAKLSVAPVSANLTALKDARIAVAGHENALREAVDAFFATNRAEWDLRVQLLTNAETMPIEDCSVPWPEDESPFLPVGRITVLPQPGWNEARSRAVDDGMSFSPWNGLAAHRPLGSIMRCRKPAYDMSADFRARFNGCPIHQPASAGDLDL
ncbi:catalase [Aureimonas sp. SA4125]|uniref:catalase family protein n=1 Tax=Aureimonas sp. SA4125 TaxID=2826993 RepID=UPI001CC5D8F6|nr:catalase family protein [Aureimonas sp. SA4125]BDA86913.1 catalase [Aureimonas sp. SA4125]